MNRNVLWYYELEIDIADEDLLPIALYKMNYSSRNILIY